jgi:hypothetical protein
VSNRLYACGHLIATILSGIVTGFYLSHSLVLGPMFYWLADPARQPLLQQTYSEFRVIHPPFVYLAVIAAQVVAVLGFAALSVWFGRNIPLTVAAAACSMAVPLLHVASGFFRLEVGVVSASLRGAPDLARFAAWNVPIHLFHTAATLAACVLLYYIRPAEVRGVGA